MATLILFNKPFGVLSQFRTDEGNDYDTLASYFRDKSLRVAGRLDATSEGLLLLTDNGKLNEFLTTPTPHTKDPAFGKTYWVQVAGMATDEQIARLASGVELKDGKTLPAVVRRLTVAETESLWQSPDAIAKRKVTDWLAITLFEGKNRQIRRMTDKVGLPCLRLVRVASHGYTVQGIGVGEFVRVAVSDKKLAEFLASRP
ncbi:MAG: pseudouridine synthase [Moraxella sp.]|nr:pseudouridine synthase [Moraxella sp.]